MMVETKWVRNNRTKMCAVLRGKIIQSYRLKSWVPCIFHRIVRSIKKRFVKYSVIVRLKDEYLSQTVQNNVQKSFGCKIKHDLPAVRGFSAKMNISAIEKLLENRAVEMVWYDRKIEAFLNTATPVVNATKVWDMGIGGEGVGIAVLDTGIHPHPDLTTPENRIVAFKDFINNRSKPYDDNGHGTHCAGDAASNGTKSVGKYSGPAPKANLIGIKVLNKMGSGVMSDLLAGIQWSIDNKEIHNIRVLSMSVGAKAISSYKEDPLCQAVEHAWEQGIVVCTAAGNEGPGEKTISTPGIDPKILTVGAGDDRNSFSIDDDTVADFSSCGPTIDGIQKPDLVAPGANIISLRSPNSYLDKNQKDARVGEWYTSLSGTSMATPVCAGVTALILEKHPEASPDQVKEILKLTSRSINNAGSNAQGKGLIDAWAALSKYVAE